MVGCAIVPLIWPGWGWTDLAGQSGKQSAEIPNSAQFALTGSHKTWRGELERCRNEFLRAFRSLARYIFCFCSR